MRHDDLDQRLIDANPSPAATPAAGLDDRAREDLIAVLETGRDLRATAGQNDRPRLDRRLLAAVAAALVVGGTATVWTATRQPPTTAQALPAPISPSRLADASTLGAILGSGTAAMDYDVMTSPTELAENSELVALGRIERFEPLADGDPLGSVIMVLGDVQVAQGELAPESAGHVRVVLRLGGEDAVPSLAEIPAGTEVVVYAGAGRTAGPGTETDEDVDRGTSPVAGQNLYIPVSPQGLAVQAAGEEVVWPALGVVRPGQVEQTLPAGNLIAP